MDITKIFSLLLSISLPALTISVEYQPIKITVNENFNAQPGQVAQGLPAIGPSFVHQGANFFFNPRVQLPLGLLPPHVEALITAIHNKNENNIIENQPDISFEDVVTEILKPIEPPGHVEETIKITEVVVPRPMEVLPELPVPEPIEVIVEEHYNEPPLLIPGGIPAPPTLPPLSFDVLPPIITDDVIIKEPSDVLPCAISISENPLFNDETIEILSPLPNIPMGPALPPIVIPEIHDSFVLEEVVKPVPCVEEIVIKEENIVPKPQEVILGIFDAVPIINHFSPYDFFTKQIKPVQGSKTYHKPATSFRAQ